MRFILTDIEGTTTSVAFVYELLFPYFKQNIAGFLQKPQAVGAKEYLNNAQQTVFEAGGKALSTDEMAQQLIDWTNEDRKHPALKAIQGLVWRFAYQNAEIKGHVFPDVPPALARWKEKGIPLGVYSSGSVEAQRLLFGFSDFGDLTPYFSHYFDTQVGPKREAQSYQVIAKTLQFPAQDILFLSDIEAELDAAAEIGMQTIQVVRPGTEAGKKHRIVLYFSEI
jgi:enolase-phosphatase E1